MQREEPLVVYVALYITLFVLTNDNAIVVRDFIKKLGSSFSITDMNMIYFSPSMLAR